MFNLCKYLIHFNPITIYHFSFVSRKTSTCRVGLLLSLNCLRFSISVIVIIHINMVSAGPQVFVRLNVSGLIFQHSIQYSNEVLGILLDIGIASPTKTGVVNVKNFYLEASNCVVQIAFPFSLCLVNPCTPSF